MKSLEYYNSTLNTMALILTDHAKDNLIYYLGLDNLNDNIQILKNIKFKKSNIIKINYEERRIVYRVYFNEIYDVILVVTFDKFVVTLKFRKHYSNERIKV
jgi:hypothetical protein